MDACSLNVTATISSHSQQDNTSEHTENFGSRLEKNHELIYLSQPFRSFFILYNFPQDPEIPSVSFYSIGTASSIKKTGFKVGLLLLRTEFV